VSLGAPTGLKDSKTRSVSRPKTRKPPVFGAPRRLNGNKESRDLTRGKRFGPLGIDDTYRSALAASP
jgi:hypothetical protein